MAEFSIIERYCQGIGVSHPETRLGVGDDAALVSLPSGMQLAISVDSMVEGVHFLANTPPADIAFKLFAVNLSDMAAMGAHPKWATMTLTLPEHNEPWLAEFSASIDATAKRFGVQLIGGDTTQGPLNISMQIIGLLPVQTGLRRSGACPGEDVYVSNTLGDAALALNLIEQAKTDKLDADSKSALLNALHRPEPQLELGQAILSLASSCIDISDGLVADLGHIAKQSNVSLLIDVDTLPVSKHYRALCLTVDDKVNYDLALTGGDDYQLAFSAPVSSRQALETLSTEIGAAITKIGTVVEKSDNAVALQTRGEQPYQIANTSGYQHFS